jgi:hypothetical protein
MAFSTAVSIKIAIPVAFLREGKEKKEIYLDQQKRYL